MLDLTNTIRAATFVCAGGTAFEAELLWRVVVQKCEAKGDNESPTVGQKTRAQLVVMRMSLSDTFTNVTLQRVTEMDRSMSTSY